MTTSKIPTNHAALTGLRVLEIASMVAGPFCGKLLAALGADVVKVEPPYAGDASRRIGPFPGDVPHPERSGHFLYLNTSKKSITLNLEDPQGRLILKSLISQSKVVIHDYQPTLASRLGLDVDTITQANPDLIVAAITPYGSHGPYADFHARHVNIFHSGGEGYLLPNGLALDTFPDRAPIVAGSQMGFYQAGLTAAVGILAAIFAKQSGTTGQFIDASSQEAQLAIGYLPLQRLAAEGLVEDRFSRFFRVGGVMPAQDGYVEILTLEPRQWEALYDLLGNPDWAAPARFQEPAKYGPEINQGIRQWSSQHTKEWLYQQGQTHGVPIAPYLTPSEVFHSKQQRERGFYSQVDHPEAGRLEYPGLPLQMGDAPIVVTRAPLLGEHNRETFKGLGYSPQEISGLARAGVI